MTARSTTGQLLVSRIIGQVRVESNLNTSIGLGSALERVDQFSSLPRAKVMEI